MCKTIDFPENFTWGVAAASYQIEGAVKEGGRTASVWDEFCRTTGKIKNGDCGDIGPDHYHRWQEDINLMAKLGVNAYRLSLAWPRILPQGTGKPNAKGLAFYDQLIDGLLAKGIEPWITLFHWDYPYSLFLKGGWLHPDSSDWFADYTSVIVNKFSDRVTHWMTLNEPQCFIHFGHQTGVHAPGLKLELHDVLQAAHNVLLSHGKAVQVIRSAAKRSARVGIAQVGIIAVPESNNPEDIDAAYKATWSITDKNTWNNSWWADPMILGRYPEDGLRLMQDSMPEIQAGDFDIIQQPLDFYGANIYTADRVRAKGNSWEKLDPGTGVPRTAMGWTIVPESLYWGPKFLYERYKLPVVITENGMANRDRIDLDGKVHDPERIDYLYRYIREYGKAIKEGLPAIGYFLWSIMDNFEWTEGFSKRFGLLYIDYVKGRRIPKDSFYWYQNLIASRGKLDKGI